MYRSKTLPVRDTPSHRMLSAERATPRPFNRHLIPSQALSLATTLRRIAMRQQRRPPQIRMPLEWIHLYRRSVVQVAMRRRFLTVAISVQQPPLSSAYPIHILHVAPPHIDTQWALSGSLWLVRWRREIMVALEIPYMAHSSVVRVLSPISQVNAPPRPLLPVTRRRTSMALDRLAHTVLRRRPIDPR
jgi:hypothetical protein